MSGETAMARELFIDEVRYVMKEERGLSERETLEFVKKGDKEAYEIIVKLYMRRAYYIALGFVKNPQDALDISQDSFVKAFRKIKGFNTEKPFFPWFYRILKNLCLDHLKKSSHRHEVPLNGVRILKGKKEDRDMKKLLWRGIEELPPEQREMIILRYFQQLSYVEIAEVTERSLGTVMSSLHYAKRKLKGILGKYLGFE